MYLFGFPCVSFLQASELRVTPACHALTLGEVNCFAAITRNPFQASQGYPSKTVPCKASLYKQEVNELLTEFQFRENVNTKEELKRKKVNILLNEFCLYIYNY